MSSTRSGNEDERVKEDLKTNILYVSPLKVFRWLVLFITILLVAHLITLFCQSFLPHKAGMNAGLDKLFNFNREGNFPAFFSALQLILTSFILFCIAGLKDLELVNKNKRYWYFLAGTFLFLAFDEAVQIHEEFSFIFRFITLHDTTGYLRWAWVVPYTLLTMGVVLYFLKFVLSLPAKTRNLFFLSGFVFVGGALGLEFFEGYYFKLYGLEHYSTKILYTLQELCEMTGIAIFNYALLDYTAPSQVKVLVSHN